MCLFAALSKHRSEVFSIEEVVALAEHHIAAIAHLVLLADIAHVEELFVVLHEELAGAVQVGADCHREERPEDELLHHVHAEHSGTEAGGEAISEGADVHVVAVLSASDVSPIFLSSCAIVAWASLKNVSCEVLHAKRYGSLMVGGNAPVAAVQVIEIVLS